ncbi:MAG TPA: polyprenyl synthetase family protein, partial [Actinomycetes bacterium]|nr:polyprenyl synthetase family protein [Actinomycetes bacterium]
MPATTPDAAADLRERVQTRLDSFLARKAGVLAEVGDELVALLDAATDLLRGGKRLRPAFCYWGWRGAGGTDTGAEGEAIIAAAASLELFQAAALVHDDLMDDSDTRRGQPAAHRRFAALHRDQGWAGEPAAFGLAGAVLLGDLLLSWSDELLMTSGLALERLADARVVFDTMRTQLMGGQYLDILAQVSGAESVQRSRHVIRFKSAKYSVEAPLLLGGRLACASDALLTSYSAYGLAVGEAFQLRDDLLGVFGDPAETGKPAGDDLREGKRTVLVATALERASAQQASVVRRLLGDPGLSGAGVDALREVLVDTGARDEVEAMIEQRSREAL